MAAGFTVASVYVVGWLRGHRDRYHRLGILIPLTVAAIATPLQLVTGDLAAAGVLADQPAKFAAMEVVTEPGGHQPEILFGRYDSATNTVHGGISIPGLDSWLVGGSTDTVVPGLSQFPPRRAALQRQRRALGVRRDGRHRHAAVPAGGVVRDRLPAAARRATLPALPVRRG
nr:hypothetical protein GCM10020092_065120 [Actinoplanes digitatis]